MIKESLQTWEKIITNIKKDYHDKLQLAFVKV